MVVEGLFSVNKENTNRSYSISLVTFVNLFKEALRHVNRCCYEFEYSFVRNLHNEEKTHKNLEIFSLDLLEEVLSFTIGTFKGTPMRQMVVCKESTP